MNDDMRSVMNGYMRSPAADSRNTVLEAEELQGQAEEDEIDASDELLAQASEAVSDDASEGTSETPALKTISVPDVQDMDYYVRQHYRSYMISALNEQLTTGGLSEMFGTPIITSEMAV